MLKLRPDGTCLASFGVKGTGERPVEEPVRRGRRPTTPHLGELLYVADSNNNRIQVLRLNGTFVASSAPTAASASPARSTSSAGSRWPRTATCGALTSGGSPRSGSTGRPPAGASDRRSGRALPARRPTALFNQPNGLDFDAQGNLLVADRMHHRFATFAPDGALLSICGDRGSTSLGFNWPRDLAVDMATGEVWLADTHQNRLQVVTPAAPAPRRTATPALLSTR